MDKVAMYKEAIYKLAEEKEKKISLGKGALIGAGIGAVPGYFGGGPLLPAAGAGVGALIQHLRQSHKTKQLQEEVLRKQLAGAN